MHKIVTNNTLAATYKTPTNNIITTPRTYRGTQSIDKDIRAKVHVTKTNCQLETHKTECQQWTLPHNTDVTGLCNIIFIRYDNNN